MLLMTPRDLHQLWQQIPLQDFVLSLIERLEVTLREWQRYQHCPRVALTHHQDLFELMPSLGPQYFSYKYVNGHSHNIAKNMPTVMGLGMLADQATGRPLMVSEMTLLTAWRTAVVSTLASKYLKPQRNHCTWGIVGTGAQSEFQVLAHHWQQPMSRLIYFDLDSGAMDKFAHHMHNESIECVAAGSVAEVMQQADCVITATVPVKPIITRDDLRPGMHLCAIGGDGPYKRELTPACLQDAKVIIEYWPQTEHEGEVKGCTRDVVHAELWEVVQSLKPGRESNDEITVFDSVGVAIEDHVVLQHVYECAQRLGLGQQVDFIPSLDDPKDLYRACFSR